MGLRTFSSTPSNGTNEVQTISTTGSPGGGTFVLSYRGQATSALAYDISTGNLQTALRALSTIGSGNVTVTGSPGAWVVTFTGELAKKAVQLIKLRTNSLTGGTNPSITIVETTPGVDATLRGQPENAILLSQTTGQLYRNTGTSTVPVWTQVDSGVIFTADVQLTNAQVKALRATPQTLVPAPGASWCLLCHGVYLVCDAAAGAYTESDDNLVVEYASGTDIVAIETTGFIDQAAAEKRYMGTTLTALYTPVSNSAIQLKNTGDGEIGGGNAANTLSVRTFYSILPVAAFS